ncbi:MAG: tandem-95 repeat protein [Verrucomicrobia bacterium]|nr:tandem-95 repeat protein [Verrucomicrobiota bacterium]
MSTSLKRRVFVGWPCHGSPLVVVALAISLLSGVTFGQSPGSLFTPQASYNLTNHLVSVSVFQWFSANGGQLTGPWRPVEGRVNWTGTTDFWRSQIKQMMAANFDMLYVHLIPSSEEQRVNLFRALNQLRSEGWNVPKVAPFLDPMITWDQQPLVDVNTAAGKDEFVNQYIRWFNQYYSVNQDAYADDYLAKINGRPVLDTWHVKFNLGNLASLSRADVETRLRNTFGASHPIFSNGVYMVTTALNDPTFAWADEKVPQFEINQYYYPANWKGIQTAQLKGGYWDQNIRNPGDFLARAGGAPYNTAWGRIVRTIHKRVYVESWNEYDEGTGIFAANAGPPYIRSGSGNTNTDVWSRTTDPYEYIKTTARGAAAFNDYPERDAKILWHNIPTRMLPGETRTATVIVRNEGDAMWSEAGKYRFGQKEFLDTLFGAGRYLMNDVQDDIPTFGGIFRGRPKTFALSIHAPITPGLYTNHWSMLQENVAWFGQELVQEILVDPTLTYHGAPQSIDSTSLLTNSIVDNSEHTYAVANLPVGHFAECAITRTFAAPIKSIKLSIVSGTADDVGYVGNILVTPDSANVNCQLGHVTNEVDVTSAVTVSRNTATLTLRARDTCCCNTGWGEDTVGGRLNARLHWQVELWPPVPISATFSNAANGHFYALLSPATWTWTERAAAALGGHLVSLGNQAEQDWVFNTFAAYAGTNRFLWIGLNDTASEGAFRWASEPVGFTYWAPGEPNNALGGEDFVTMYPPGHPQAGRWNDWGERVFSGNQPFNGVAEFVGPMGPPQIDQQPQGGKVNPGVPFAFTVHASGSPTLRYQWRFNGTDIPGATTTFMALPNVQFTNAGDYSVVVSNALGSIVSSNARLIVNHAPVPNPKTVSLDEDTSLSITLDGSDVDGDSLGYALFTQPIHGRLIGVAPAVTYVPDHDYFGPDEFSFKVTDGMLESAPATASITVLPVNDAPVANTQALSVNEDTSLPLTLTGFDVEGNALTYSVVSPPTHGSLSGTATNLAYLAVTNYFGPDGFTFKVNDGQLDSIPATISLTVLPVNDAPEPKIVVSPLTKLPGISNLVVIARVCCNAVVILDGSQSADVENDSLQFVWTEGTNTLGTTATVTNHFAPGNHVVNLAVTDGVDTNTATATFAVLTPAQAVHSLVLAVCEAESVRKHGKEHGHDDDKEHGKEDGKGHSEELLETLRDAEDAFKRCQARSGLHKLEEFQHKVRAQIGRRDPALAQTLIETAQEIMDIVGGTRSSPCHVVFDKVTPCERGKMQMKFSARKSENYFVQASTDLKTWKIIGVAEACGDGTFLFEDPCAGKHPQRFYRILTP